MSAFAPICPRRRTGGQARRSGPGQHALRAPVGEGPHQAGLADAGLSADHDDAASVGDRPGDEASEFVELLIALQKHPMIVDRGRCLSGGAGP